MAKKQLVINRRIDKIRVGGFAIPTVLIASIIMLTVLVVAVSSIVAVRVALRDQYYSQLNKLSGDAGVAYAKACLDQNAGKPLWSDSAPLKPNTDCSGIPLPGFSCPEDATDNRCFVTKDGNTTSGFTINCPSCSPSVTLNEISVSTSVNLLRTSTGSVWRQYVASSKYGKVMLPPHWSQLASGDYFACGIASDYNVYCWGLNGSGQLGNNSTANASGPVAVVTTGVLSGKTIKAISSGSSHACAIASDDSAYCWGANGNGQLGNSSTTPSLVPVAVDTTGVLSGKTIKAISVGSSFTCAIASDNNAYCWGANTASGRLGNNSTTDSNIPVAVDTTGVLSGKTIKSIYSGDYHTCVVASDDKAYCWGLNGNGQLGNNSTTSTLVPVAVYATGVLSGKTIKAITGGEIHTCAIASDNKAYCWGANGSGQLGDNSTTQRTAPVAVYATGVLNGKTVLSITAGYRHTCAIASDSKAYCWGLNGSGQLGDNSTTQRTVPVAVYSTGALSGKTIKTISTGSHYTCTIASDSKAYCWGSNTNGQLGNNSTIQSQVPTPVNAAASGSLTTSTTFSGIAISNSGDDTCALASDNKVYCWGKNSGGAYPTAINSSGLTFKAITKGPTHTCGIASDDKAYCWGSNSNGQLGRTGGDSSTPVAVSTAGVLSGLTIKAITAGGRASYSDNHTCVIASDDKAYCWGYNSSGQLGNNSTTQSSIPVAVDTTGVLSGKTILDISSGGSYTCVIASDNKAYCWGNNTAGQLGNNSTTQSSIPVAVNTAGVLNGLNMTKITAGGGGSNYDHTCALASTNAAYCWGRGTSGQLGNGAYSNSLIPVTVSGGNTFKSIYAGYTTSCAITTDIDNKAYCWGSNSYPLSPYYTGVIVSNAPALLNSTGTLNSYTVQSIPQGSYNGCALSSSPDSMVYCFGLNDFGQVGDGSTTYRFPPVSIFRITQTILTIPTDTRY